MPTRVYVGNLPVNIKEREIDDLFYKYGRILEIDIKTPSRPPAFAFIIFEDARDADDAIKGRDGYSFDGERLRVELAKGERGLDDRGGGSRYGGKRTEYSVIITGLPRSCSWQDLKDFMRKAGDVVFTDVTRGEGVCDYSSREDMDRAVRRLDDTEFTSYRSDERCYIRVKYANRRDADRKESSRDRGGRGRDDSRSRSRSRSRSKSRGGSEDRDRDRAKRRKRSPSRSRSSSSSSSDSEPRKPASREPASEDA